MVNLSSHDLDRRLENIQWCCKIQFDYNHGGDKIKYELATFCNRANIVQHTNI